MIKDSVSPNEGNLPTCYKSQVASAFNKNTLKLSTHRPMGSQREKYYETPVFSYLYDECLNSA